MIITKKKKKEDILKSLGAAKKIYLFGCNSCAQQCKTGGPEELKDMTKFLTGDGREVLGSSLVDETCYRQAVRKEFRQHEEAKEADAILVLACGAGVKNVAETAAEEQVVMPALDSTYLAKVERVGQFFEGCALCGECVLADTGGICPHTECPKGLLNGPCGGVADAMCEVDTDNKCAWVRIYDRLKIQNRLHIMETPTAPKDYSIPGRPKKTVIER